MHRSTRTLVVGLAAGATIAVGLAAAPQAHAAPSAAAKTDPRLTAFVRHQAAIRDGHAHVADSALASRPAAPDAAASAPHVVAAGHPYVVYANGDDSGLTTVDTSARSAAALATVPQPAEVSASPDGSKVVTDYVDDSNADNDAGIAVVSSSTGAVTRLTSVPQTTDAPYDVKPAVSPDGSTVAFVRQIDPTTADGEVSALLYTVPAGGGPLTEVDSLGDVPSGEAVVAWSADGSALFYATGDPDCAIFKVVLSGNVSSCALEESTLVDATGESTAEISDLGWGGGTGALPFAVVGLSAPSIVDQLGVLTLSGGAVELLPPTRAVVSFSDESNGDQVVNDDIVYSPTIDPSGTTVAYERDTARELDDSSGEPISFTGTTAAAYSGDLSTGTHRAKVANTTFGEGVGAYWPASGFTPSTYVPLSSPQRILDTRDGTGLSGGTAARLNTSTPIDVQVTGNAGVPSGATAVVLNLTAIRPSRAAYVQIYPTPASGSAVPTVSTIDLNAGQVLPNAVTVALPASGTLRLRVSTGDVDVAADVTGYYVAGSADSLFTPLATPTRVLDTRSGTGARKGALPPKGFVDVKVAGAVGVPSTATAVVLDLGAIEHGTSAFVTAYPTPASGTNPPTTSTLDLAGVGTTLENLTTVGIGAGGDVRVYNSDNTADVFADVIGYYDSEDDTPNGSTFVPLTPSRILDTRDGTNTVNGAIGAIGQGKAIDARGDGQLTTAYGTNDVPEASAIQVNLTAVAASASTYLTLYATPTNGSRPTASAVDVAKGTTIANGAITAIGSNGQVRLFNATGSTGAILDIAGFFLRPSAD